MLLVQTPRYHMAKLKKGNSFIKQIKETDYD